MDIRAEQVAVRLGGRTIIENIDMEVSNRQFVGIVGPNGSGKSTFLKTIYRALKPGRQRVAGRQAHGSGLPAGIGQDAGRHDPDEHTQL